MNENQIYAHIIKHLEDAGHNIDKIDHHTRIGEGMGGAGLDSLDRMELTVELERVTFKPCPIEAEQSFNTIGDVVEFFKD